MTAEVRPVECGHTPAVLFTGATDVICFEIVKPDTGSSVLYVAADAFQASSLDAPSRGTDDEDAAALLAAVPVHDQRFELVEYASVVRGTMAALPERDREAIRLRFGEDLTQDEIAQRLGISQMQVSRLLRRALERLRTVAEASTLD